MTLYLAIIGLGAGCAATLCLASIVYRPRTIPQWSFLIAMALLAVRGVFHFVSLRESGTAEDMLFWQRAATLPAATLPLVWLLFSLTYARGNASQFLRRWLPALLLLGVAPIIWALLNWRTSVQGYEWVAAGGNWRFPISPAGKVVHFSAILAAVLVLMNLEWTFRSAVGTARWKVKYAVFGLLLFCGAQIYTHSQIILYSVNTPNLILVNSAATTIACAFFAVSFFRSKLSHVDIYPSPSALHHSLTFLLAGAYLVAVGLLAKAAAIAEGGREFPFAALIILVGLSGLAVFSLSDRVRNTTRAFITRHFARPTYDYRRLWLTFTQRTAAVLDRQEYCRQLVGFVSETFETLSVTVWLTEPAGERFMFAASTSLDSQSASALPVPESVYRELAGSLPDPVEPVDLDQSKASWCRLLLESNPNCFPSIGGNRVCLPLLHGGGLAGLLVLGDRVRATPFTSEDCELLKCLGVQFAAGLRTLTLSEKLVRAKEMEAFSAMSAFLVHDLKNTASALSLTLRNLPTHFDNPAFREDALRTLSRSAQRINELIGRLSTLRGKLELRRRSVDLNEILTGALRSVVLRSGVQLTTDCQPLPKLSLDATHIESVIVNLVLNAQEAIPQNGEIKIQTAVLDGEALLSVSDTGCGMSSEFLSTALFQPFKTSKKTGLGIGMYQTKTVIEAHGGRIIVESVVGKGTTFRVSFPLSVAA